MSSLYATALVLLTLILGVECAQELIFSIVLFRHGERERYNPLHPNMRCYKHLINQGMRQLYVSGRYFRNRYVKQQHFLPFILDPATIYFRSTYLSRALTSTLSFYSGLYQPDLFQSDATQFHGIKLPFRTNQKATEKTYSQDWVPHSPTIHTLFKDDDRLLYSYKKFVCPAMNSLKKSKWMSDRAKDLAEEGMLGDEAKTHPYAQVANTPQLVKLATHNVLIQFVNHLHLALVHKGFDVGRTESEILQELMYRDPAYKKYQRWRKSNPSSSKLKMVVYGSHDTMVVSAVNALGVKYDKRVGVASTISVELFIDEVTHKPMIEVQLNGKKLNIPTCRKGTCTLRQFEQAVDIYGTFDSEEEYRENCLHMYFGKPNDEEEQ